MREIVEGYVIKLRSGAFVKKFNRLKANGGIVITERTLDINEAYVLKTKSEVEEVTKRLPAGIKILTIKED